MYTSSPINDQSNRKVGMYEICLLVIVAAMHSSFSAAEKQAQYLLYDSKTKIFPEKMWVYYVLIISIILTTTQHFFYYRTVFLLYYCNFYTIFIQLHIHISLPSRFTPDNKNKSYYCIFFLLTTTHS